MVCSIAITT